MTRRLDLDATGFVAAIRAPKKTGQSPLYLYLFDHWDSVGPALSKPGLNWQAAAAWCAENGIADGNGKPPTAQTLQHTAWRVRKAREAATKPKAPTPLVAAVSTSNQPPANQPPIVAQRPRFGPVRM